MSSPWFWWERFVVRKENPGKCVLGPARRVDRQRHMTIAEFISIEDSLRLCAQLQDSAPRGSFLCDRVEFIVPDDDFRFRKELAFPLGTS